MSEPTPLPVNRVAKFFEPTAPAGSPPPDPPPADPLALAAAAMLNTVARVMAQAADLWRHGSGITAATRAAGVLPAEVPGMEAIAAWPLLAARLGLERFAAALPAAERAIVWPAAAAIEARAVGEALRLGLTEADVRYLAPAGHPVVGVGEMSALWADMWGQFLAATTGE